MDKNWETKQIKITIENSDLEKLEFTISEFGNIDDWQKAFRVVLKWQEYTDGTVDELFNCNSFGEPLSDEN